ncbi:MAG: ArsR/SmtB family transcription factor [Gemmatimonadaceae bacterium]|jgi:DNA-binding transcriptional ArsR family regulator
MRPDFDLLGDPMRRLMLALLATEHELCVCEFETATNLIQPVVSRQLSVLREGGWVMSRRVGRWMVYRLADDRPAWADQVVAALVAGGVSAQELSAAAGRLAGFVSRPTPLLRRAS